MVKYCLLASLLMSCIPDDSENAGTDYQTIVDHGTCYRYAYERCFAYHDCGLETEPYECIRIIVERECIDEVYTPHELNNCASYYSVVTCDTLTNSTFCTNPN